MTRFTFFLIAVFFFYKTEASTDFKPSEETKNNPTWIIVCQDDKAYLDVEKITVSSKGIIVVDEENNEITLPELFSDEKGIYIRTTSLKPYLATVWNIVWCHTCEAWRSVDWNGKCVVCHKDP